MNDYDIDIREFEPTYKHLLARQANREVADGREVALSGIRVHVNLTRQSGERDRYPYEVSFSVDHDQNQIEVDKVSDPYQNRHGMDPERFNLATSVASAAVLDWVEAVGIDYRAPRDGDRVAASEDAPEVHIDLTVMPEGYDDD